MAQSPEERRAADAKRKREARAAAKAARQREAADVADAAPVSTVMQDSVAASLLAMKWLKDSDAASVQQAKSLAQLIDELEHRGDLTRALSAHRALSRVLNDLAATPATRLQHEVRSARVGAVRGGDDGGNDEAKPSNVSKFQRPTKRRRG